MARWPSKDPDEVLDYSFDWSPRGIAGDVIETATATVVTGDVVVDLMSIVSGELTTTTWLSGGTNGMACTIRLRIVTEAGRTLDETVSINIKTR